MISWYIIIGLRKAGYEYILLDDGWTDCGEYDSNGGCLKQLAQPRDAKGYMKIDKKKFPYVIMIYHIIIYIHIGDCYYMYYNTCVCYINRDSNHYLIMYTVAD